MSIKPAFYLSLGFVTGCASAFAQTPSFNCSTATYPDERSICSNAELSELDNVANAGYQYVRRVYGAQYSKSIDLPLLQARRACGSDAACIKEQQLAAIQKFQSLGAPVNSPQNAEPGGPPTSPLGSSAPAPQAIRTPKRFVVTMEASVSDGGRPIVTGTTNLPDGMQLYMFLLKPFLPDAMERYGRNKILLERGQLNELLFLCDAALFVNHDCSALFGPADPAKVKNGRFTYGPFTDHGAAIPPGSGYILEIVDTFADRDAEAIIGSHGENMIGPLVKDCCFEPYWTQAEIKKKKAEALNPALSNYIYYARYITITPDPPSISDPNIAILIILPILLGGLFLFVLHRKQANKNSAADDAATPNEAAEELKDTATRQGVHQTEKQSQGEAKLDHERKNSLRSCRECKAQVSTEAAFCPHCGVRSPTDIEPLLVAAAGSGK